MNAIRAKTEQPILVCSKNRRVKFPEAIQYDLIRMMELVHVSIRDEGELRRKLIQERLGRRCEATVMTYLQAGSQDLARHC